MKGSIVMTAGLLLACTSAFAAPPASTPTPAVLGAAPKAVAYTCALPPKTESFSFWQTCSNVTLNGCTLSANCKTASGGTRTTTFNMNQFPNCPSVAFSGQNMYNDNGKLCCGYAGYTVICGT